MKKKVVSLLLGLVLTTNLCFAAEGCSEKQNAKSKVFGIGIHTPFRLNVGCVDVNANANKAEKDEAVKKINQSEASFFRLDLLKTIQIRIF